MFRYSELVVQKTLTDIRTALTDGSDDNEIRIKLSDVRQVFTSGYSSIIILFLCLVDTQLPFCRYLIRSVVTTNEYLEFIRYTDPKLLEVAHEHVIKHISYNATPSMTILKLVPAEENHVLKNYLQPLDIMMFKINDRPGKILEYMAETRTLVFQLAIWFASAWYIRPGGWFTGVDYVDMRDSVISGICKEIERVEAKLPIELYDFAYQMPWYSEYTTPQIICVDDVFKEAMPADDDKLDPES